MTDTVYDKAGLYVGVIVPDPPSESQVAHHVNAYADRYRTPLNSDWLSKDLSNQGDKRWYHNVNHAMEVTDRLAACRQPDARELAYMFGFNHDRYYSGGRSGSDEAFSAEMMVVDYIVCKLHDSVGFNGVATLTAAYAAILATAQHTMDQTKLPVCVKVCLDADLYSLADDYVYARNAKAVYLESKAFGVSDKDYLARRIEWLTAMLTRKSIFLTYGIGDLDTLNAKALRNMKHELSKLEPLAEEMADEACVNGDPDT